MEKTRRKRSRIGRRRGRAPAEARRVHGVLAVVVCGVTACGGDRASPARANGASPGAEASFERELTAWPGPENGPRVSPDGTTLAFDAVRSGSATIFLMHLETGASRAITDGSSNDRRATWSPDGRSLAFISDQGGSPSLRTMAADGTGRRPVLEGDGTSLSAPDWSPDGRHVALSRLDPSRAGNAAYGRSTVVVVDVADGTVTELTDGGDEWWPAWSSDGAWLYYYKGLTDDLEAVHTRTHEVRPIRPDGLIGWRPAASPAEDLVAFVSDVLGYGLWVAPLEAAGDDRRLLADGEPDSPVFTPDGSAVVLTRDTTSTFVVRVDMNAARRDTIAMGRAPQALTDGSVAYLADGRRRSFVVVRTGAVTDTVRTPLDHLTDFAFSPGGTRLVVAAPGPTNARHDLHLLRADGAYVRRLTEVGDAFRYITWCDDDRSVLYSSKSDRRVNVFRHLWSVDVETGRTTRLTEPDGPGQAPTHCDQGTGRITFQHVINASGSFSLERPGGAVRFLGSGSSARWSPDGRRLLYVDRVDGRTDLFVREGDGSVTRVTDDDAVEADPSWSADGEAIVFGVRTPNRGIWIVPVHPVTGPAGGG